MNIYTSYHRWSVQVCNSFAAGTDFPVVPPAPLLPGDVFMYGALRGLLPTLKRARLEGRTWFYADNGYFLPGKTEDSYFRITRNALQIDGSGDAPAARWKRLGLKIKPWRKRGDHIVICPPARVFGETFGFDADEWLQHTLRALARHTARELRVRPKITSTDIKRDAIYKARPLEADLDGAWALVTHSSNSAVEALMAGIPVFCTVSCASSAMGLSNLDLIESPRTDGDRERWARVLASNQWTLGEMRDGTAWRMLCAQDG